MPRRENKFLREPFYISYAHGAITADINVKLFKATRKLVIDRAWYSNPTGLAEDAANSVEIRVANGLKFPAEYNTLPARDGSIPANQVIDLVLNSDTDDRVVDVDDVLAFSVDTTGTVTLPAGSWFVSGYFV